MCPSRLSERAGGACSACERGQNFLIGPVVIDKEAFDVFEHGHEIILLSC